MWGGGDSWPMNCGVAPEWGITYGWVEQDGGGRASQVAWTLAQSSPTCPQAFLTPSLASLSPTSSCTTLLYHPALASLTPPSPLSPPPLLSSPRPCFFHTLLVPITHFTHPLLFASFTNVDIFLSPSFFPPHPSSLRVYLALSISTSLLSPHFPAFVPT